MAKLLPCLQAPHLVSSINRGTLSFILSKPIPFRSSSSSSFLQCRFAFALSPSPASRRCLSVRAFEDSASETKRLDREEADAANEVPMNSEGGRARDEDYPSGEFEFEKFGPWRSFLVKLKMLVAFPWERVRKFIVAYIPTCQEKEYYLACACEEIYAPPSAYVSLFGLTVQASFLRGIFDKIGIEPQVERIGKYKSAGDQLARRNMSEENCEMLTTLLDNIYDNWLDKISSIKGKKKEDIESFINEGVYQIERLKEDGWITNIQYEDEVLNVLILSAKMKYSKVRQSTVGLSGGGDQIAVIRAGGSISRVKSPLSVPSSGIIGEQFIEKIRSVRESKKFKAAIIRIDSPGGDALASDLMWREIRLLAASKPVVASMADVAASGGYYMAMAAGTIVAENLTLTGSIGVVTGKFNLGKLYEKIGFNKEIISRGRFAELLAAEQRPFRPDEAELFAKSAQNAYKQFRDKAAFSRSMTVDEMEKVAQGRVWTGKLAASHGLVDAIGGFSRAVAIAKQKANIPQDSKVNLVELSRPSPTLLEVVSGVGSTIIGVEGTVKELLQDLALSEGVQARMEGIMLQRMEGFAYGNSVFDMLGAVGLRLEVKLIALCSRQRFDSGSEKIEETWE
ncbi:Serine protease SPPA, chloroplastic, partial [Cucurbita argyrosperma subsp. sororia]